MNYRQDAFCRWDPNGTPASSHGNTREGGKKNVEEAEDERGDRDDDDDDDDDEDEDDEEDDDAILDRLDE